MSRLKIKSIAVGKESRYLNVHKAPGCKGFKREFYRVIVITSKGQLMHKVRFPSPERALHFMTIQVQPKGFINTNHWEK